MATKKTKNDALPIEEQVTQMRKTIAGLKGHNKKLSDRLAQKETDLKQVAAALNGFMAKCSKYREQIECDKEIIEDLGRRNREMTARLENFERPWWKRLFR